MNITFFSNVSTSLTVFRNLPEFSAHNVKFFRLSEAERLISEAADTQVLILDAMGTADERLISSLPGLKLIQSEGVGYQGVDLYAAEKRGIAVCNNKGVNDTAVAESAILLMLGCLRSIITGHQSVYDGRQIEVKMASFGVIKELGECTVGLIGFGDIARMTAKFVNALGARVLYTNRTRYESLEAEYGVTYADMDLLLSRSDLVSLHLAVTDETRNMVNSAFLSKMKKESYLINTSRGDLVDNQALFNALLNGDIAGAGLDVISPEPVKADNLLLDDRIKDKLILTPHIAGITSLTVEKIYKNAYENIIRILAGEPLINRII